MTIIKPRFSKVWRLPSLAVLSMAALLSGAQVAQACTNPAGVAGDQIYNTDFNVMQFCDGTDWTAMRGLWRYYTTHITRGSSATSGFHVLDEGLAAGSTTAGLDGDGIRAFYDPDKGAFRGGTMSLAWGGWEDANVGDSSLAWGGAAMASGNNSFVLGHRSTASGAYSQAFGHEVRATGQSATAIGSGGLTVAGSNSFGYASGNSAGNLRQITGNFSFGAFVGTGTYSHIISADRATVFMSGDQTGLDYAANDTFGVLGMPMVIDTATPSGNTGPDASAALDLTSLDKGFLAPRVSDPTSAIAAPATGLIAYNTVTDLYEFYDGTAWRTIGYGASVSGPFEATGGAGLEVVRNDNTIAPYTTADFLFGAPTLDDDGINQARMFFDKSKSAFRVGTTEDAATAGGTTDEWDDANVGNYSVGIGIRAEASGLYAHALGNYTVASGNESTAIGWSSDATGHGSVALGVHSVASSGGSVSVGPFSAASGFRSVATAEYSNASGSNSMSYGNSSEASGYGSSTFGFEVQAGNGTAQAVDSNTSVGNYSIAFGVGNVVNTISPSYPQVTGNQSAGFFLGDQEGSDITGEELFAILGEAVVVSDAGAGTSVATPASAIMQLDSTDKGFLAPRVSNPTAAISTPAEGLIAYDLVTQKYQYFDGASWQDIGTGAAPTIPADSLDWDDFTDVMTLDATTTIDMDTNTANFNFDSNTFVIDSANNRVGLGTATPTAMLDLQGLATTTRDILIQNDSGDTRVNIMADNFDNGSIQIFNNLDEEKFYASNTSVVLNPQNGTIAGRTGAPDLSAEFEIDSADKGFLAPRVSDPTSAITAPATGLIAYNTVTDLYQFFDGTSWVDFGAGAGANFINDLGDATTDYVTDFNMFMGDNAGASIAVGGQYNLAIGQNAGDAITTSSSNIAIGYNAATNLATGAGRNVVIGENAFASATAGFDSVAIGHEAIANAAGTPDWGVAIGAYAANVAGTDGNTAVGYSALRNSGGSAGDKTAIGNSALRHTRGGSNVAVGAYAGQGVATISTAENSVFVGYESGLAITTGNDNTLVGHQAGTALTTGADNVVIGRSALDAATDLNGLVIIGKNAAGAATTLVGIPGAIIGTESARSITHLTGVTTLGTNSLFSAQADRVINSTALGQAALFSSGSTGNARENTAVGAFSAGWMAEGGSNVFLGREAGDGLGGGAQAWNGSSNVMIGRNSATNLTLGPSDNNVFIGRDTAATLAAGSSNIVIGHNADVSGAAVSNELNIGDTIFGDLGNNKIGIGMADATGIDASAVLQVDAGTNPAGYGGFLAPRVSDPTSAITGPATGLMAYNTVTDLYEFFDGTAWRTMGYGVGGGAIDDLTDASTDYVTDFNMFMGDQAGASIAVGGQYNLAIGQNAGDAITTASQNVILGYNALTASTIGGGNVVIGNNSLASATNPAGNVAVGNNSMESISGLNNTALGHFSLRYGNGDGNLALGYGAMSGAVAGPKNANTAVGVNSGSDLSTGDNNILLGYGAGELITSGSNNIVIGYDIDTTGVTASNELNIGDLIYGDMTAGNVGIGTATPASELQVVGDIQVSNYVKYDGVAGNAPTYDIPAIALNELTDVVVPAPAANEVLTWNGTNWINQAASGGVNVLDDLSDVFHDTTTDFDGGSDDDDDNLALGHEFPALDGASPGSKNTAIGAGALVSLTTGDANLAIGFESSFDLADGSANTTVGAESGEQITSGSDNTGYGYRSLARITTGNLNTGLGRDAGRFITDGSTGNETSGTSVYVGADTKAGADGNANEIVIGYNAIGNGSDTVTLGNASITDTILRGEVGIGNTAPDVELDVTGDIEYTGTLTDVSDKRLKTDIHSLSTSDMIDKIAMLDTYSFKMKGDEKGRVEMGVMAQDLEKIFPELVKTANDEIGTKSVNYMGLIAPMIEATKALNEQNKALTLEMASLQNDRASTQASLESLNKQVTLLNKAYLENNMKEASFAPSNNVWMLLLLGFMGGGAFVWAFNRRPLPKS